MNASVYTLNVCIVISCYSTTTLSIHPFVYHQLLFVGFSQNGCTLTWVISHTHKSITSCYLWYSVCPPVLGDGFAHYGTVESPNKGHFGTASFVLCEEVILVAGSKCSSAMGYFGTSSRVLCREVLISKCPLLEISLYFWDFDIVQMS